MTTATLPEEEVEIQFAPYGKNLDTGEVYKAHPTQQKVLNWVHAIRNGEYKKTGIPVLYLQHGVDAGGTRAVLAPVVECLFEYPGIRVLDGRKDYNDLRLSAMETFSEIMPPIMVAKKDEQEHRYEIATKGENSPTSTIFFRELKDVKGLGSQEFAIIVVHEAHEIEEITYRTLKQRCRQAGYPLMILMEGNPPAYGHWLNRLTDPKHKDHDPDIERIILSSYENWDNMTPAYRTSLESQPPAWRKRYLLGETAMLPSGDPVYPSFVESVHVQETSLVPDRPVLRFWDFGLRRAACLWAQITDNHKLLIHREWMALQTPEEEFIDGVVVRTNGWFPGRICKDYGDPAARNRDPHGESTLRRLQTRSIQLMYKDTTYGERIPLINKLLSEMVEGVPRVTISPYCQILNEGLSGGYHYQEQKEGASFGNALEVPFKDGWFEHLANAFEYGMVNIFGGAATSHVREAIKAKKQRNDRIKQNQSAAVF